MGQALHAAALSEAAMAAALAAHLEQLLLSAAATVCAAPATWQEGASDAATAPEAWQAEAGASSVSATGVAVGVAAT